MVGQLLGRTFISYSRKDGAEFAAGLRGWLAERNLSVWQDIVALEGGRDWWSQIEETLKSKGLQHFILVVTPASLASPFVRREIRLARQEGKTACPVKGPGLGDLSKLPRWLGQIYDLDLVEHQTTLIRVLEADSRQKRVPMMAPEPPPDFVPRPKEFDALKRCLLDAKGDAVAGITAALKGAGGYGKTTLAKALAHDPDIQDAFFDGILWAELGEKPEGLLSILADQIELLTGERPGLETINAAAGKFSESLGDRRILLIVDDAWREQDLRPFLQGGPNCVRLVTTRIDSVLPSTALRQPVDAMQRDEALALISAGLPPDQVADERTKLAKLAARLGEWALLLKIVNGFLRDRVVRAKESSSEAIVGANKRLDAKGLVAFDPRDESDRAKAVARTIGISLELLSESERSRFGKLGVFPEDAEIPVGVVARLWETTGGFADFETEDLLTRFFNLSLLLDLDLGQRFFRLHDTTRHYLRDCAGKDGLVTQHQQLVSALDGVGSEPTDARTRRYFYLYLPQHLAEAGKHERLDSLLLDPGWLKAKLDAIANPQALVEDYWRYGGAGEAQRLIGRALQLITGICARDGRQLLPQLIGRLAASESVAGSAFLESARRIVRRPAIIPLRPTLTASRAETARLEGHTDLVFALCMLPDGRLASGSGDETIRLWDVMTGIETARIEGDSVNDLCPLLDGRLASSQYTGGDPILLWDVSTGTETARLKGHTRGGIHALCRLPDGRLASACGDKTIRLWNVTTGAETVRLEAHSDDVTALCVLPDGRLASGSNDNTILLWDVTTGAETACLKSLSFVHALCALPDGLAASSRHDISLWDVETGAETARLKGHSDNVTALCVLPDGRLASASYDRTIRVWDLTTKAETTRLEGHLGKVFALCMLPDGRLASGSEDMTIRLWDVAPGAKAARLAGDTEAITALCLLPDGQLATGYDEGTIWLRDVATGAETARLPRQPHGIGTFCSLPDGRLAVCAWDKTIGLWDVASEAEAARFEGNWDECFTALCLLPDGRLASGTFDGMIQLWDVATGAKSARHKGGGGNIQALCVLPDGRLASHSWGKIIELWDLMAGIEIVRLEGHTSTVEGVCMLPNGCLASGSLDRTVRLWDLVTGAEIARLELDAPVRAIIAVAPNLIVVGGEQGSLHWLEVLD